MLIDMSTSITIMVSILTAALTAILTVYLTTKEIPKKRCYIMITIIALLSISVIFFLHFWDVATKGILNTYISILVSTKSWLNETQCAIGNFTNNLGVYLLLAAELIPWILFFPVLLFSNVRHNVLTGVGHFWLSFVIPCLVISLEIIGSLQIFELLQSKGCTEHILWILIVSLILHIAVIKLIYKQFSRIWRE